LNGYRSAAVRLTLSRTAAGSASHDHGRGGGRDACTRESASRSGWTHLREGACMNKPNRPCAEPGCAQYALPGRSRCRTHTREDNRRIDAARTNPLRKEYAGARWKALRAWQLRRAPLCVDCFKEGRIVPAHEVDHVVPHKGDLLLFYDQDNLQSLCRPCHSRKTVLEDGGFGMIK
jgi:5-methylcytosine-specific restriction enzyme A